MHACVYIYVYVSSECVCILDLETYLNKNPEASIIRKS